ncbi:MAG TPA: alpha/beta fold hydrolase, partial [Candidatus Binataceae bacterium]|nr:alpha/beta fold hydrolase [Candidatus Binataceae bacterium]
MRKPDDRLFGVMIREATTWFDMGALFASPVFYGIRVPPGDGKVVVVIPGFMGNDLYLQPMLNWLDRIGYTSASSSLNPSAGCLDRSCQQVKREIDRHLTRKQRSIALIGHSRGGAVAWALAAQMQEQVSHLVMLGAGTPGFFRSVEDGSQRSRLNEMSKMLLHANRLSRSALHPDCRFPSCECSFTNNAERSLSQATALLSIYGNDDLVVPDSAKILEGEIIHVP